MADLAATVERPRIRIPVRFENVLSRPELEPTPLIIPMEDDLAKFDLLRRTAEVQGGGLLALVLGETGVGKTTAVYSTATHMSDRFAPVLPVPADVPLREVGAWLTANLPDADGRVNLVLFDGREVTDDDVGLRQLIAALNQLLRTRPDVLMIWPTTDDAWRAEIQSVAERIGGDSLIPTEALVAIRGPSRDLWGSILDRLLMQLDATLDDLALTEDGVADLIARSRNVGHFLSALAKGVAARVDSVQLVNQLPAVLFVVTSTSEVVGEANRLRRAGTFLLKAGELLAYSPRSNAGRWWRERLAVPEHHLGYIISLFSARLATMTPSSVAYACAEFADDSLRAGLKDAGIGRHRSNADRTLRNTDFYRLLANQTTSELTSTHKGRTAEATGNAYAFLQGQSATRHKVINQAICSLVDRNVETVDAAKAEFEVNQGEQGLYTDVVLPWNGDDTCVEFHHAKEARASAMASYIMEKLQYYAIHYNLIPR